MIFYHNNACDIKVKGHLFKGFALSSGVRQGCPLSPLIFVLVTDILLRRLQANFPTCTTRAFADDNAMVLSDFWRMAPGILQIYKEFGKMSNLQLNLSKTVVIPLWPCSLASVRDIIKNDMPQWSAAELATDSKYVGFQVGPSRVGKEWDAALAKYSSRACAWSKLQLGLQYSARAYNVFVCTVLVFMAGVRTPIGSFSL